MGDGVGGTVRRQGARGRRGPSCAALEPRKPGCAQRLRSPLPPPSPPPRPQTKASLGAHLQPGGRRVALGQAELDLQHGVREAGDLAAAEGGAAWGAGGSASSGPWTRRCWRRRALALNQRGRSLPLWAHGPANQVAAPSLHAAHTAQAQPARASDRRQFRPRPIHPRHCPTPLSTARPLSARPNHAPGTARPPTCG
jgi:hypothetical protein